VDGSGPWWTAKAPRNSERFLKSNGNQEPVRERIEDRIELREIGRRERFMISNWCLTASDSAAPHERRR